MIEDNATSERKRRDDESFHLGHSDPVKIERGQVPDNAVTPCRSEEGCRRFPRHRKKT